jgi:hypothetical protein
MRLVEFGITAAQDDAALLLRATSIVKTMTTSRLFKQQPKRCSRTS